MCKIIIQCIKIKYKNFDDITYLKIQNISIYYIEKILKILISLPQF
jgi:hypothetical protein